MALFAKLRPHKPPSETLSYQLPPGARRLARRAIQRDLDEGADIILLKPAGSYLDIIRDAKEINPDIVIAAYQVSGEYLTLYIAAEAGVASLEELMFESCEAMIRAGATVRVVNKQSDPQIFV